MTTLADLEAALTEYREILPRLDCRADGVHTVEHMRLADVATDLSPRLLAFVQAWDAWVAGPMDVTGEPCRTVDEYPAIYDARDALEREET